MVQVVGKRAMRAAIVRTAKKHPQRIERGCSYAERDYDSGEYVPSCLIGTVLHDEFGVSIDMLRHLDNHGSFAVPETPAELLRVGLRLTAEAVEIARVAQHMQDKGQEWAAVIRSLDVVYGVRS